MPIETTNTEPRSDSPLGFEVARALAQDILVCLAGAPNDVLPNAPLPNFTEFPLYRPDAGRASLSLGFRHAGRILCAARGWRPATADFGGRGVWKTLIGSRDGEDVPELPPNFGRVGQLPSIWNGFFLKRADQSITNALRHATLPGFALSSGVCGVQQFDSSTGDLYTNHKIVPAIFVHSFSERPWPDLEPRHMAAVLNGVSSAVRTAVDHRIAALHPRERTHLETHLRRTIFVVDTSKLRGRTAAVVEQRVGAPTYLESGASKLLFDPVARELWPTRFQTNRVELGETMLAKVALQMAADTAVSGALRTSGRTSDGWRSSQLKVDGNYQAFLFDHADHGLKLVVVNGVARFDQLPTDSLEVAQLAQYASRKFATVDATTLPISTSHHLRNGSPPCAFLIRQVSGKHTKGLLRPALVELLAVIGEAHDNPYAADYNSVHDLATGLARQSNAFSIKFEDLKIPKRSGAMHTAPIPGMDHRDGDGEVREIRWTSRRINPKSVMQAWDA